MHLEWLVRGDDRWETAGAASGDHALAVTTPRSFVVVPNDLLRRA